jgi:hypothetical protein
VRVPPIADKTLLGLRRRGAGRWGVPVAAIASVAMTVGVSAALTVNRIDHGTAVDGGRLTVTHAAASFAAGPSGAGPSGAAGR